MRRTTKAIAVGATVLALGGAGTALAASGTSQTKRNDTAGTPPTPLTSGEQTALQAAVAAIDAQASSIAKPVLDAQVTAGTITSAQETSLLALLSKIGLHHDGGPGGFGGHGPGGPGGPWGGSTGQTGSTGATG